MILRSLDVSAARELEADVPVAPVVSLFATTHRWWKLAVDSAASGAARFALAGIASTVVWQGSVATVPCVSPENGDLGPCACGLHAPATAVARARSVAPVVVGGSVRVLSAGHGDGDAPQAVVAVEGPLRLHAWCEGSQDGITLERCDGRPRWAVAAAHAGSAFCRRHLRSVPESVSRDRERLADFQLRAAAGLSRRYGVDVHIGPETPTRSTLGLLIEPVETAPVPKPRRTRLGFEDRS